MTEDSPILPVPRRGLTPGCLMMLVGVVWLTFLLIWMVWSGFRTRNEIASWADRDAKLVTPAQPEAAQLLALREKMKAFGTAVNANEKASLTLTVDDLNTLLAAEEVMRAMKENAKVLTITPDGLTMQVSVAMNGLPFLDERFYLNGNALMRPEPHRESGLVLLTKEIVVPGKTLSEGFVSKYKENNHLDRLLMDPLRVDQYRAVIDVLKKVTVIRLADGAVTLDYAP